MSTLGEALKARRAAAGRVRVEVPELAELLGPGPLVFYLPPETLGQAVRFEQAQEHSLHDAVIAYVVEAAQDEAGAALFEPGEEGVLWGALAEDAGALLRAVGVARSESRTSAEAQARKN